MLLVLKHQFWVLVVEEKASRVDMETAIPQCLAYMAGSPNLEKPVYGLVTNGHQFAFLKLQRRSQTEYRISDTLSLRLAPLVPEAITPEYSVQYFADFAANSRSSLKFCR